MPNQKHLGDILQSDVASSDPLRDGFKRLPFARRVAGVLAARQDPSSIVVAIHGKWGEGKTTVLGYIHEALCAPEYRRIVPVRFNPWRFRDESDLLVSFFGMVAGALDRSTKTNAQKFGEILGTYVKPLASIGFGAGISADKAVGEIAETLKNNPLEEQKKRFEKMLVEEGKRVIVFLDDLDRLDRDQIQSVVRLLKLTASFDYVDYVLAFDRNVVAAAIAGQFGDGHEYLQKLVQVNLDLPVVDRASLGEMALKGIFDALAAADVQLSDHQKSEFQAVFEPYILPALRTPRLAKQYANATAFMIPLLVGEVNIVDLLLLEAVKCLYPELYHHIRESHTHFTGEMTLLEGIPDNAEEEKKKQTHSFLDKVGAVDRKRAEDLIGTLFPQMVNVHGKGYGGVSERASREQRVCVGMYLRRYLTCSVPSDDISDKTIDLLLAASETDLDIQLAEMLNCDAQWLVIQKLRERISELSSNMSWSLAQSLARQGELLKDPSDFSFSMYESTARLIQELLPTVDRLGCAIEITSTAEPLPFAGACLRAFLDRREESEQREMFSEEQKRSLDASLASRIASSAAQVSLAETWPRHYIFLLSIWKNVDGPDPVKSYLRDEFGRKPALAKDFISRSVDPYRIPINSESYLAICAYVDVDDLIAAFTGEGLLEDKNKEREARYAKQFVEFHEKQLNHQA